MSYRPFRSNLVVDVRVARTIAVSLLAVGLVAFAQVIAPRAIFAQPVEEDAGSETPREEADPMAAADEVATDFVDELGIEWKAGPTTGALGRIAEVEIPEGFYFCDGNDTRTLFEAMGNLTSGQEVGAIAPVDPNETWLVEFSFNDVGYIKDDDKDALDADAMLRSIREDTARGNEERRRRGIGELEVLGWEVEPRYDERTNNLEWALLGANDEGGRFVNHNTRLLGRRGVMKALLIADPEDLDRLLPTFHGLLDGFSYTEGNRYAEFREGDKIAKYGLAALVTGGATFAAIKSGLFAKLWKPIVGALVIVAAFFKRIVGSLFGTNRRRSKYGDDVESEAGSERARRIQRDSESE